MNSELLDVMPMRTDIGPSHWAQIAGKETQKGSAILKYVQGEVRPSAREETGIRESTAFAVVHYLQVVQIGRMLG
jgi:hypothetical protein